MTDKQRIGLRQIRAIRPGETIWDASLPAFGARRQRSNTVSYVLFYRTKEGRQRWFTIGRHGAPWTPDSARDEARRLLGEVTAGADPAADKQTVRKAHTVSELSDMYLRDAEAGRLMTRRRKPKKASTLVTDRGRIERHIKPLLGSYKISAVTRADIDQFMHDVATGKTAGRTKTAKQRGLAHVRGGRGTASRTVGLLGAIFTYAVRHHMRSDNPVHGVMRPADGQRDRRLNDAEYEAFGAALRAAEAASVWPAAIAVARFLALTGWRSGEALALRWNAVDLARRTATLSAATARYQDGPQCAPVVPRRLRCSSQTAQDRTPCFPGDSRRRPHERFSQAVEQNCRAGRTAGGRDAARVAAFVRQPRWRSRLQRTYHRRSDRPQRAFDYLPLCARSRRGTACRGRRGCEPHCGINGRGAINCQSRGIAQSERMSGPPAHPRQTLFKTDKTRKS